MHWMQYHLLPTGWGEAEAGDETYLGRSLQAIQLNPHKSALLPAYIAKRVTSHHGPLASCPIEQGSMAFGCQSSSTASTKMDVASETSPNQVASKARSFYSTAAVLRSVGPEQDHSFSAGKNGTELESTPSTLMNMTPFWHEAGLAGPTDRHNAGLLRHNSLLAIGTIATLLKKVPLTPVAGPLVSCSPTLLI